MKSCFLRSDVPGSREWWIQVPVGTLPWDAGSRWWEGCDGEVGGTLTQENVFSPFPPVNLLLGSSSSSEIMQRSDTSRNPIWDYPAPSFPGDPKGTVWVCISPAKAPCTAGGANPMLSGSVRFPLRAKHGTQAAVFRKSQQRSLSTSQITPLCLNTLSPKGELSH